MVKKTIITYDYSPEKKREIIENKRQLEIAMKIERMPMSPRNKIQIISKMIKAGRVSSRQIYLDDFL